MEAASVSAIKGSKVTIPRTTTKDFLITAKPTPAAFSLTMRVLSSYTDTVLLYCMLELT